MRVSSRTPHPVIARINALIRTICGGDRFNNLAHELAAEIDAMNAKLGKKITLMDYGCGSMATARFMLETGRVSDVACVDTYAPPVPDANNPGQPIWSKYVQAQSLPLPFADQHFDMAMTVDVLHHVGIEESVPVLRDLARCAKYVLVKDVFEYGFISRQLLRLADWFGNYAFGVNVPTRYFDPHSWQQTVDKAGLMVVHFRVGITIHEGLFGVIQPPKHHFMTVLTRKT